MFWLVQILEHKPKEEESEAIAVSENEGISLLTEKMNEYILPRDVWPIEIDDLLEQLPLKLCVEVFKRKIAKIKEFSPDIEI